MSYTEKLETIQSLQTCLQRSRDSCFILMFKGETEEVKKFQDKNEALNDEINRLITEAMLDWTKEANAVTEQVKKANATLQRAITGIKKQQKEAENIAKAFGIVDDVLSIARTLLSATKPV